MHTIVRRSSIRGFVPSCAKSSKNKPFGIVTRHISYIEGLCEAQVALEDDERLFWRTDSALSAVRQRRQHERECYARGLISHEELTKSESFLDSIERRIQDLSHARAIRLRDVIRPEVKRCARAAEDAA